jgi:hypothetical protein
MADKTISIRHAPDGVVADYDSAPFLRDAGNTYGVRRVSDGAVMLAPTALTQTDTGVYSITVTGLAADGTEYEYALERTYLGLLRRTVTQFTVTAGGAIGFWTTQAAVEQTYGLDNCDTDVDLSDNGQGKPAVWQQALDLTDARIDLLIAGYGKSRPVAQSGTAYNYVNRVAQAQVRRDIHRPRGSQETNAAGGPNTGGVFDKEADELWAELESYLESGSLDFPDVTDTAGEVQGTAPVMLRPTVDAEGRALVAAATFDRPYWDPNGGYWRP